MNDVLQNFEAFIEKESLFTFKDRLLLAVSGGVDSVVLCELCHRLKYSFVIAHCNFKLRGGESDRDEAFVRSLGERYNVEVFVKQFDTIAYTEKHKVSIQVAARELRYAWFNEIIDTESQTSNLKFQIVTAHHADDNIETVLMSFFKGTGIAGLRGILPKKGRLIRPLLFASKKMIVDFATQNNLLYVEDSSNLTDKYTRNYFRQHIVPAVVQIFPEAESNLQENILRFRETELLYRQAVEAHKKKLIEYKGTEVHISVLKLKQSVPLKTIVFEIIKDYGFSSRQTDEIIDLTDSGSGKYIVSNTHRVLKNRSWLIITPLEKMEALEMAVIVIKEPGTTTVFAGGTLQVKSEQVEKIKMENVRQSAVYIDAKYVQYPLILRRWRTGDYFYPLGMKKKKKLSRFFIDQKLSLAQKERVWVLETNKKIIWVVNYRLDDRFKIEPGTKDCLRLEFHHTEGV